MFKGSAPAFILVIVGAVLHVPSVAEPRPVTHAPSVPRTNVGLQKMPHYAATSVCKLCWGFAASVSLSIYTGIFSCLVHDDVPTRSASQKLGRDKRTFGSERTSNLSDTTITRN